MQTNTNHRSPFVPLCEALDHLEILTPLASTPACFALKAMVDVVDQSFQLALTLAEGRDIRARNARRQFQIVTGKLLEVSRLLELPDDSSARKCLALIKWGA